MDPPGPDPIYPWGLVQLEKRGHYIWLFQKKNTNNHKIILFILFYLFIIFDGMYFFFFFLESIIIIFFEKQTHIQRRGKMVLTQRHTTTPLKSYGNF